MYALPGTTFYPDLDNAPTGLAGTVGVRVIRNSDDATVVARTTAGIREVPAGSGHYLATVTAPTVGGEYTILWDTGVVSPSTTASEELTVTSTLRPPIAPPATGGPFVVSLIGYVPPPRYDGVPWTQAIIEEAPAAEGEWSVIEVVALAPVDTDPAAPIQRNFTTESATLDAGYYRVLWADATNDQSLPTPPVFHGTAATDAMRPSVRRIAAILRARPKTVGGATLTSFTSETNPTADQVEELIDEAMNEVLAQTGFDPPEALWPMVASTVAVRAAQFVELGYPEVLGTARTSFDELETIYKDRLPWLLEAIQEAETGDVEAGGGGADAAWGFPAATWGFIESERA